MGGGGGEVVGFTCLALAQGINVVLRGGEVRWSSAALEYPSPQAGRLTQLNGMR